MKTAKLIIFYTICVNRTLNHPTDSYVGCDEKAAALASALAPLVLSNSLQNVSTGKVLLHEYINNEEL